MAAPRLTRKQEQFVREFLVDMNATQAAIRAGYSPKTAYSIASENLRKPEIIQALQEARQRLANRLDVTQEKVVREYARHRLCLDGSLHDLAGRARHAEILGGPDG